MYQSGATCLPTNCCFSELAYKNPAKCVGLVQADIIIISSNVICSRHDIDEKKIHFAKYQHNNLNQRL
jgi:hypothetical protein